MYSRDVLQKWSKNRRVNPLTGRAIDPTAKNGVYAKLKAAHAALRKGLKGGMSLFNVDAVFSDTTYTGQGYSGAKNISRINVIPVYHYGSNGSDKDLQGNKLEGTMCCVLPLIKESLKLTAMNRPLTPLPMLKSNWPTMLSCINDILVYDFGFNVTNVLENILWVSVYNGHLNVWVKADNYLVSRAPSFRWNNIYEGVFNVSCETLSNYQQPKDVFIKRSLSNFEVKEFVDIDENLQNTIKSIGGTWNDITGINSLVLNARTGLRMSL